jgi:hypothetical protein
MAHYAKVVDGIVVNVIVAEPDFFETFIDDTPGEWIQTSYNTRGGVHYDPETRLPSADQTKALRKNFAGIGYTYDREQDVFIAPAPFPSWILDEATGIWGPPTPMPDDDSNYFWVEEEGGWVEAGTDLP